MKHYSSVSVRRIIWFILLMSGRIGVNYAQSWIGDHQNINKAYFSPENSRPHSRSFNDMIGVTGGTNWDGLIDPNPVAHFIKNARSFHLMEIDYRYISNPSRYPVVPCLNDCDEVICYPLRSDDLPGANSDKSTFAYYKHRYCKKWQPYFENVFASVEAITPYYKNRKNREEGYEVRGYPNKWYTAEEWGGTPKAIQMNAKHYAKNFAATFCPADTNKNCLVQVLEIGNEPWGIPGRDAYHAISRGFVEALKEYYGSDNPDDWRMKLSSGAFQADTYPSNLNDYIDEMIPDDIIPYLDYLSIHPYAFDINTKKLTATPESKEGQFLRLKNLEEWRRIKAPHTKINVSEFGWNSKTPYKGNPGIGERAQAIYLSRAILLMSRYGVDKSFIYELIDMPSVDIYNSTGLLTPDFKPKLAYFALEKFFTRFGDLHFTKALVEENEEGGTYAYLLGNAENKPSHLVVWNATDIRNIITFPSYYTVKELVLPPNLAIDTTAVFQYLSWNDNHDSPVFSSNIVAHKGAEQQKVTIRVNAVPLIIPLRNTGCQYDQNGKPLTVDSRNECADLLPAPILQGDETACPPYNPGPITIHLSATEERADLEYRWQKSTSGPDSGWTDIPGAFEKEYDPPLLNKDTWFRRLERKTDCEDYSIANVIKKGADPSLCTGSKIHISKIQDLEFQADDYGSAWVSWSVPTAGSTCKLNNQYCGTYPEDFTEIGRLDQKLYLLYLKKITWPEARKKCRSIGGQLALVKNNEQNEVIKKGLAATNVKDAFIGINDERTDQKFLWLDGSLPIYRNWSQRSVSFVGKRDYGYIATQADGQWLLADAETELPCLCEIECFEPVDSVKVVQTRGPANQNWLSVGQYGITYYAFDNCGNFTNTSFQITVTPSETPICQQETPDGYQDLGRFEQSRYLVGKEQLEWPEAKLACEAENGHLAVLTSKPENNWLAQQLKDHKISTAFIGLSDELIDGSLQWVNYVNSGYSNWQTKIYPQNSLPDYVYMGNWNDGPWLVASSSYTAKQYICEVPCVAPIEDPVSFKNNEKSNTVSLARAGISSLFPNPAKETITFQFAKTDLKKLNIFTTAGKLVWNKRIEPGIENMDLNIGFLNPGLYFVTLENQESEPEILKFIKK